MSETHEFLGHDPFPATPSKGEEAEPVAFVNSVDLEALATGVTDGITARRLKGLLANTPLFASPTSRGEDRSFAASIEGQTLCHRALTRASLGLPGWQNDIDKALDALEALSALSKARSAGTQHEREKVIEECAVVAERRPPGVDGASIAKSIRSLKRSPNAGEQA